MIKNWTVKTQQKKNFIKHYNYLVDKKRSSHYFSEIVTLINSSKNILSAFDERKKFRQENSLRGGGVTNECTSFTLSLPRDIKQPTTGQWKLILKETFKELEKDINKSIDRDNKRELERRSDLTKKHKKRALMPNVSAVDLYKHSVAVLHDESASPKKSSHVHLLISNVMKNEVIKPISQFAATHAVKKAFNKSVLKVLNENHLEYEPKKKSNKNMPLWAARQLQLKQQFDDFKDKILSLKTKTEIWFKVFKLNNRKNDSVTNIKANSVVDVLEDLENKNKIDYSDNFKDLEQNAKESPNSTKVTSERKRRRRKRK